MSSLFESFSLQSIEVSGATIRCRVGGQGPPLLLLHGCPETHLMWHKLAPALSSQFTVVAADLRGYGASSKPRGLPNHENYAFRAMALDQLEVMRRLGFGTFAAVGHDRGARVLHRMALDHPNALTRIALLDILPTTVLYHNADRTFATSYWEWFFFVQAAHFPEALLSANPEAFLRHEFAGLLDNGTIAPEVWSEYVRAYSSDGAMHGMCEDYRAGASIDLVHDEADRARKITCPLLVVWGARNPIWRRFDMLEVWKEFATHVAGSPIDAGHYLAEEAPTEVLSRLRPFLNEHVA